MKIRESSLKEIIELTKSLIKGFCECDPKPEEVTHYAKKNRKKIKKIVELSRFKENKKNYDRAIESLYAQVVVFGEVVYSSFIASMQSGTAWLSKNDTLEYHKFIMALGLFLRETSEE